MGSLDLVQAAWWNPLSWSDTCVHAINRNVGAGALTGAVGGGAGAIIGAGMGGILAADTCLNG